VAGIKEGLNCQPDKKGARKNSGMSLKSQNGN